MSKVYVLQTRDADEDQAVSVYDNLDNAKTVAHAWLAEQFEESEPPPMLEWQDHDGQSSMKNTGDYEEWICIWVRDVITKLPE